MPPCAAQPPAGWWRWLQSLGCTRKRCSWAPPCWTDSSRQQRCAPGCAAAGGLRVAGRPARRPALLAFWACCSCLVLMDVSVHVAVCCAQLQPANALLAASTAPPPVQGVPRTQLQLVCVACMLVAAKHEEVRCAALGCVATCCGNMLWLLTLLCVVPSALLALAQPASHRWAWWLVRPSWAPVLAVRLCCASCLPCSCCRLLPPLVVHCREWNWRVDYVCRRCTHQYWTSPTSQTTASW